ncbi:MAG: sodium:proton antiporter, partial [Planctomycetota bacterium]|nr:sodium:proton antiporter [Planctomycetota bacterium]
GAVAARLEESGVAHPVTAVLLNFRGYDTLLELGVLWLAWLAVAAAGPRPDLRPDLRAEAPAGPVLAALVSQLVPLLILVGAYLLWAGAHAPGGAFQAGAILAGGGVLLRLSGVPLPEAARAAPVVGLGFALFLGVGLAQAAAGRRFLELLPAQAHDLLVLVEVAATVSIAAVLAALFAGRRSVS